MLIGACNHMMYPVRGAHPGAQRPHGPKVPDIPLGPVRLPRPYINCYDIDTNHERLPPHAPYDALCSTMVVSTGVSYRFHLSGVPLEWPVQGQLKTLLTGC